MGPSGSDHGPQAVRNHHTDTVFEAPASGIANIVANNSNPFVTNSKPGPQRGLRRNVDSSPSLKTSKQPSPLSTSSSNITTSKNPFHKLIHHSDKDLNVKSEHKMRNRAKSLLGIRNSSTVHAGVPPPSSGRVLHRASTSSHLNQLKDHSSIPTGAAIARKHDKIVFNPYGMNNGPPALPKDQSFYLEDTDLKNVLPMPIENPNDHLPQDMKQLHVDLVDFYEIPDKLKSKPIGDGASSEVRIINEIGNKDKKYALKKLLLFKNEAPDHFYKRVVAEYIIAKNVSNGFHIVTTLELLRISTSNGFTRGWGITMELCEGGDLFSLATSAKFRQTGKEERLCIFKQIAFGIKYLHEKDIAHIDLKPENVLLTKGGVVKLTDFGISRFAHKQVGDFNSEINYITRPVGSAPYSPPEMMELEKNKNVQVEPFKVDMWALGVLLSVLFYSKLPFNEASSKDEAYRKYLLSLGSFEAKVNPGMKTIGLGPGSDYQLGEKFHSKEASYMCWRLMDPSDTRRYTLEQLFVDPFFEKIKTCTDELSHLDDKEDELCNHEHVLEMREKGYYSSANSSSESLHKPIRSMLNIAGSNTSSQPPPPPPPASVGISRSSSISSTLSSYATSGRIPSSHQSYQSPISPSPIRSMLDPLPLTALSPVPLRNTAVRLSSASVERRKSYDTNAKFQLMRTTSNSSSRSGSDTLESPMKPDLTLVTEDLPLSSSSPQQQQNTESSPPSELPPLEEDEDEKDDNDNPESMVDSITVVSPSPEDHPKECNESDQTQDQNNGHSNNVSVVSLPKQRIFRDTHVGDNDNFLIDKEHGLVETHLLINDETLKKCCCFDSNIKHKHVEVTKK